MRETAESANRLCTPVQDRHHKRAVMCPCVHVDIPVSRYRQKTFPHNCSNARSLNDLEWVLGCGGRVAPPTMKSPVPASNGALTLVIGSEGRLSSNGVPTPELQYETAPRDNKHAFYRHSINYHSHCNCKASKQSQTEAPCTVPLTSTSPSRTCPFPLSNCGSYP